jgi:hypothetical protein
MSLGPPSAGHDGVPSETSFAFANLTVEPASRNGMSAAAQALGASARTRLGHGPRAKAHVDYGAWSRGRLDGSRETRSRVSDVSASHASHGRHDTSETSRDAFDSSQTRDDARSTRTHTYPYGVRLDAHPYPNAFGYGTAGADGADHDKSAFVTGSLVSDLLTSLEALGGARPHPAATLLKRCVASHEDAHGAGGTWSLVLGTSLCGAADTLRDAHGMDARSILDAFQEATRLIIAWVVPRLAAPAREAAAAFPADALDAAVAEARTRIRPRLEPGTVSVADARVIAALILGLDRGRHPGDASLALAAALTLARRRRMNGKGADDADGETKEKGGDEKKQNATETSSVATDASYGPQSQNTQNTQNISACLRLDHRDAAVGMVTPGPCASRSFLVPGAVLPVDESATSRGVADALAEATKGGGADERFDFALLLDDEALAEEDIDDVARAVTDAICAISLDSLEKKPTVSISPMRRLVLFRSDETREGRVAALARALERLSKNILLEENARHHPPLVRAVVGPGVKRATLRALARTVGGSVVLDARAVEPGDLARSARVSCAAAGWDPDDSATIPPRRGSRADAPRRFAIVTRSSGEEENANRARTGAKTKTGKTGVRAPSRLTASLVLFDRTETAANARAAEFRRTMRRVSHALACPFSRERGGGGARVSDWSLLFPEEEDDDDDDDATRRGRVLPGGGCFELAAAAALARAARVARSRVADAARALDAEEARVRAALAALAAADAPLAPAAAEASRYAASEAERRRESLERETDRARALDAFAECLRDVHRVAAQNGGSRFDDAVARGARAEAALGEAFFGSRDDDDDDVLRHCSSEEEDVFAAAMARVKVSAWRVAWAALADAETAAPRLEEARARASRACTPRWASRDASSPRDRS